ncbi:MAG: ABC transporter permease, partial [Candidatus Hodarchaeota archaeon]
MDKDSLIFRFGQALQFMIPFIIIAGVWEFLVMLHNFILNPDLLPPFIREVSIILNILALDPLLFPPPSKIFTTFLDLLLTKHPSLIDHLIRSLFHIFMGYSIGVGLGIAVGTIMGINRTIYTSLNPILGLLISVPTLAWVPLLLIIIGLGDETIIIAIFLGCFFPIVYNTLNGIRSTDPQLIRAAEIMGAGKVDIYFEVLLPSSLLSTITGLR